MEEHKRHMWKELVQNGLPKLIEQGVLITVLIIGTVILFQDKNKSSADLIEYLKNDHARMIEALTENTKATKESNEINKELLHQLRSNK